MPFTLLVLNRGRIRTGFSQEIVRLLKNPENSSEKMLERRSKLPCSDGQSQDFSSQLAPTNLLTAYGAKLTDNCLDPPGDKPEKVLKSGLSFPIFKVYFPALYTGA